METVLSIHREGRPGDVLAFLTGQEEVEKTVAELRLATITSILLLTYCVLRLKLDVSIYSNVDNSSSTSSRDLFLFWVHSALPQKLSRRFFFTSFGGTLKISLSAIGWLQSLIFSSVVDLLCLAPQVYGAPIFRGNFQNNIKIYK